LPRAERPPEKEVRVLSTVLEATVDSDRDPVVVLAADENFAMPLAATVRSALDNLAADRKLRIFVLDGGLSDATKQRLERSWPSGRYQLAWVDVDPSQVRHMPITADKHLNHITYYRVLMPWVVPQEIERAVYLDSDMIVLADLSRLWDDGLHGDVCRAAQDSGVPCIDPRVALANYRRCRRHLGSSTPVPNYRELGLDPAAPYFNAGVLIVDLPRWRNADLTNRVLACLEQNRPYVRWSDQYALNVVLTGGWGQLDPRWNQGANIFAFPSWSQSPFDRQTFEQLRDDPYIVHFTTRYKPWLVTCLHPLRKTFFEYVDRTAWAGWRPPRFSSPRAFVGLLQAQQRRFRHARKRWQSRAIDWLHHHQRAAIN
jgi:lipopolysaccharide biosynthesis glycosyltransferase